MLFFINFRTFNVKNLGWTWVVFSDSLGLLLRRLNCCLNIFPFERFIDVAACVFMVNLAYHNFCLAIFSFLYFSKIINFCYSTYDYAHIYDKMYNSIFSNHLCLYFDYVYNNFHNDPKLEDLYYKFCNNADIYQIHL